MSYKFKYGTHEIEVPKRSESLCYQYDLGANVNLNNLTNEGYYHQSANVNTSLALNYPTAEAGLLTVIHRNYIYQTYQTYNNSGFWYRSYYDGTWYAWKKVPDINGDTFNGIVNGYYFNASHNQGLRSNGIEIIYGNNGITYLPNQNVVINNSLDVSKGVDVRGTLYSHGDCWLGVQFSTTGWLGFYNAYGGTRKAWIGHDGSSTFYTRNETGGPFYWGTTFAGLHFIQDSGRWDANFMPASNGHTSLGTTSHRFSDLYVLYSPNVASDKRLKCDFKEFDNRFEKMFLLLSPLRYKLKQEEEDNQYHSGFVAQDLKNAMENCGISDYEFVAYQYDEKNDNYSILYEELIALNTHMIQKLLTNFKQQQEEINILKKDIDELKKKFIKEQ